MSIDLTPIVQPILVALGAVITGVVAIYVPKAIAAFQDRTGIVLTENQRQTILDGVKTAGGVLETALDRGVAKVEHITVGSPVVQDQAQAVINALPNAAAALGLNADSVARMIVGRVDTGSHGVTTAVTQAIGPDQVVTETTQGAKT